MLLLFESANEMLRKNDDCSTKIAFNRVANDINISSNAHSRFRMSDSIVLLNLRYVIVCITETLLIACEWFCKEALCFATIIENL